MKNLGLFGKSAIRHVRNQRSTPADDARATSEKIDEIESELSAEFGNTPWLPVAAAHLPDEPLPTLSQCLDEAALLFTNYQVESARDLLLRARDAPGNDAERRQVWWMLFELALCENQPAFFEQLALDYARSFESSPPQWQAGKASPPVSATSIPAVNFRGKLCASSLPALQQLQQAGIKHLHFCLEFSAITDIDLDGCALLLQVLAHWQLHHCKLHITNGEVLTDALRPLIQTGRRDSNDAAWRLLIELMRLMNRCEDYESLCLDYSLTYEISPPAAPLHISEYTAPAAPFLLPECIALPTDELLQQMQAHARHCTALILDGQRLKRVELSAAAPWLNGLHRVSAGKPVECRNLGFLVSRLLQLVGGGSQLTIIHRKP